MGERCMGCVKLGSLASRGWLTCPPLPPLSILIPAMHSMGGTGFISMLDGDHWRGEGAGMREGGRGTRGDRGTETKDPTKHHESKRVRLCTTPLPQPSPTYVQWCMQAPRAPPPRPPTPTPTYPHHGLTDLLQEEKRH